MGLFRFLFLINLLFVLHSGVKSAGITKLPLKSHSTNRTLDGPSIVLDKTLDQQKDSYDYAVCTKMSQLPSTIFCDIHFWSYESSTYKQTCNFVKYGDKKNELYENVKSINRLGKEKVILLLQGQNDTSGRHYTYFYHFNVRDCNGMVLTTGMEGDANNTITNEIVVYEDMTYDHIVSRKYGSTVMCDKKSYNYDGEYFMSKRMNYSLNNAVFDPVKRNLFVRGNNLTTKDYHLIFDGTCGTSLVARPLLTIESPVEVVSSGKKGSYVMCHTEKVSFNETDVQCNAFDGEGYSHRSFDFSFPRELQLVKASVIPNGGFLFLTGDKSCDGRGCWNLTMTAVYNNNNYTSDYEFECSESRDAFVLDVLDRRNVIEVTYFCEHLKKRNRMKSRLNARRFSWAFL